MNSHPMKGPIEFISLGEIIQDRSVWPRADYDEEALKRYWECFNQLPPVRVDRISRVLLDGFHRVRVFKQAGKEAIPVTFEDCPPERYLLRALQLNTHHGVPVPLAQRNHVISQLSEQGFTQQEIAQAVGLSQEQVSRICTMHNLDRANGKRVLDAIRLAEQGRSLREAGKLTAVPRSTLERAVLLAKQRQELIRQHLQSRNGLTSLLRYADRGPWGNPAYFGNCTGYLVVDLLDYFKPACVFDPMEGSGTTGEVCFDLKVDYTGFDLRSGFNLLTSPLPDQRFDLIFWHPPYWPGHKYSDHPDDFSNASGFEDYLKRLRDGFGRLSNLISPNGHLVTLIGDGRKNGVFYPVHSKIIEWGLLPLEAILIKEGDHERRARHFRYGPTRFIPTLHEYVLIFKGGGK